MKKKCLVAVYCHKRMDGRCLRAIRMLKEMDLEVQVIASSSVVDYSNEFFFINKNLETGFWNWLRFCIFLFGYIARRRREYDLLYLLNNQVCIVGWFSSLFFRKKWVYDAFECLMGCKRYPLKLDGNFIFYILERLSIKKASLVIAANYERARLLKYAYRLKHVTYVANILPYSGRYAISQRKIYKKGEDFVILYQGFIGQERNLSIFIEALSFLPEFCKLKIVGGGEVQELNYLKSLVSQLHLGERVMFTGPVPYDQLITQTQNSDLGIVTYKSWNLNTYYCSPNKIYEYANYTRWRN